MQTDVVVVGSGVAGLVAALAAAVAGARVLVLEKSGSLGGTSAVSGGVLWVPCNPWQRAAGLPDSRDDALRYLERITLGRVPRARLERYVDVAPEMVSFLAETAGIPFECLTTYPDYHAELPGGRAGGRSLDAGLFDTHRLGPRRTDLRKNPVTGRAPMTIAEAMAWGVFWNPLGFPYQEVAARAKAGVVHGGASLVGQLLCALFARGVEVRVSSPARRLLLERGGVVGVVTEQDGVETEVRARGGVVLASGGFEWDPALRAAFVPGLTHPVSVPSSDGDGLRLALSAGAALGNMSEAWWTPAVALPGETYDGAPLYRSEFSVRCLPHSIIVNGRGERFTSEAHNYNDMTKPFLDHRVAGHAPANLPAWVVVDGQYLERYLLVTALKGRPLPEYIVSAESLTALAARLELPAGALEATVERFNGHARAGHDPEQRRGEGAFERFYGDPRQEPNPNLGTLERPPFCAVPLHVGAMGTKGGPLTGPSGEVLRHDGTAVPGLYAAGNVAASVMGPGYPGAGATLGAAGTFGYLAGRAAAAAARAP